jgi:hypothetical protein
MYAIFLNWLAWISDPNDYFSIMQMTVGKAALIAVERNKKTMIKREIKFPKSPILKV